MSLLRRLFGYLLNKVSGSKTSSAPAPKLPAHPPFDVEAEYKAHKGVESAPNPKPFHRRGIYLDRRLLAKKKPSPRDFSTWWAWKGKKWLSRDEARRLFSATNRVEDPRRLALLMDRGQLERYGLPEWSTDEELARDLGLTVKRLHFFSSIRRADRYFHYVMFAIPKRSGGERIIMAPKRELKSLQRRLNDLLCRHLPRSPHAHGFVRGRSVASNAAPHVGRKVLLKLDLKDFFPTLTFGRVRGLLIAYGYSHAVASTLAAIMTESTRQPVETPDGIRWVPTSPRHCVQGAPTSPALANALTLRMDRRLAGMAASKGFHYTRYADDLTFSGDEAGNLESLHATARRIIHSEGFTPNPAKTRILRNGARQHTCGVTVNTVAGLSRRERRLLRAALHRANQQGHGTTPELQGKLAYVRMLNPDQAGPLERMIMRRQP